MKRKAPQKECPECKSLSHARTSVCKSCNHVFYVRKKDQQEKLAANWRDLKAGDVIKCITGSGPYFVSKVMPGERIMLGEKGKFEVVQIVDQGPKSCGIVGRQLYSRGRRSNVTEFIYMGETYYDDNMCSHKEPHKIKVIKKVTQSPSHA